MEGIQRIDVNNLTLKISKYYDPNKLDLDSWDDYLNCLCQGRLYQKDAIKNAIIYLASGRYKTINDLAFENFNSNNELKDKYDGSFNKLEKTLPMPNMSSLILTFPKASVSQTEPAWPCALH